MPKAERGTPKDIANRMKAKGKPNLEKNKDKRLDKINLLRFYVCFIFCDFELRKRNKNEWGLKLAKIKLRNLGIMKA